MHAAGEHLKRIRERTPLIHHITNWVVTNFTANVTLALGASPVMAHAPEEVEEMASCAGALVINIGTLTLPLVETALRAGRAANASGVPVVLDPVGAGATRLRTESASRILNETKVNVIRGNLSEVASLAGEDVAIRGVDSAATGIDASRLAFSLARRLDCTVAVTGPVDWISDGNGLYSVHNGHPLLGRVTGTGCAATAVVAAFAAVEKDLASAAASGLAFFGLAAERAAKEAPGPGTFATRLLDEIYAISQEDLARGARVKRLEAGQDEA
ncbi:MAG: hydroxyethylthiazole kinase [Bacillota bacterium]